MSWKEGSFYRPIWSSPIKNQPSVFGMNRFCFVRKELECGKFFGASKSCFIACPTNTDLEPVLALISEKLTKFGIEPIIAVKERAYGQDIFCTKICGKIIEARFCLVILDDTIVNDNKIPNPNVYYEYGLMTALGKHIVPLQKDGQILAFNIQSYDTIKYNNSNMNSELDRALRDAVKITEDKNNEVEEIRLSEKSLLRRIELSGLDEIDKNDDTDSDMSEIVSDTLFKVFVNGKEEKYILIGKIDNENEFSTYLEDIDIIVYRIENLLVSSQNEIVPLKEKIDSFDQSDTSTAKGISHISGSELYRRERELGSLNSQLSHMNERVNKIKEVGIGFVIDNLSG